VAGADRARGQGCPPGEMTMSSLWADRAQRSGCPPGGVTMSAQAADGTLAAGVSARRGDNVICVGGQL